MASTRRWHRPVGLRTLSTILVVGVLAGAVPLVLAHSLSNGPVAARSAVAPPQTWTTSDSSWANSTQSTFNATFQFASYSGNAFTITATNTSSTTVEIETTITAAANYSELGCLKPCTPSGVTFRTSSVSASTESYFENYTTSASVIENGSSASALGVLNAQERLSTQSAEYVNGPGPGGVPISGSVVGSSSGSNAFAFPGAFGIVPWTAAANTAWNGTGAFNLSSQFQQNYTVTGIFTNLSGILGVGGEPTPFVTGVAPANGSGGSPNGSGGGYVGPPPPFGGGYGLGFSGGAMMFCGPQNGSTGYPSGNGTGVYDPWQNTSCTFTTTGTEYALGGIYGAPYFNASYAPVLVGFEGPYVPGPALSEVISGSDLFGGAALHWPPIEVLGGFYGYGGGVGLPGIGTPLGSGSPSTPPEVPPIPAPFNLPKGTPLAPASHPAAASGSMPTAETLGLVAVAALAGIVGTVLVLRRRPGPPPAPGTPP